MFVFTVVGVCDSGAVEGGRGRLRQLVDGPNARASPNVIHICSPLHCLQLITLWLLHLFCNPILYFFVVLRPLQTSDEAIPRKVLVQRPFCGRQTIPRTCNASSQLGRGPSRFDGAWTLGGTGHTAVDSCIGRARRHKSSSRVEELSCLDKRRQGF